jgi:ankyrin repeat protein
MDLILAADAGDLVQLQTVIRDGHSVNTGCRLPGSGFKIGGTALMYAARGGHLACVLALLAVDSKVDVQDKEGWSALHYACFSGHTAIAVELLRRNANAAVRPCECAARVLHLQGAAPRCHAHWHSPHDPTTTANPAVRCTERYSWTPPSQRAELQLMLRRLNDLPFRHLFLLLAQVLR